MKKRTIQLYNKLKAKIEAHRAPVLDLTSNDWKNDKKFNLVGLKVLTRPWKKLALVLAIFTFIFTSFIPGPNVLGFYLVKTILGRFG